MKAKDLWFKHDFNARTDDKIKRLLFRKGPHGYGLYWLLIETLYCHPDNILNKEDVEMFCHEARCTTEDFYDLVNNYGLFIVSEAGIENNRVNEQVEKIAEISEKNAQKGKKSAEVRAAKRGKKTVKKAPVQPLFNTGATDKEEDKEEDKRSTTLFSDVVPVNMNDYTAVCNYIKTYRPDSVEPYVAAWNLWAVKNNKAKIKAVTATRKVNLRNRLKNKQFDFIAVLNEAEVCTLLLEASWFSFDWIIQKEDNFIKTLEGKYRFKNPTQQNQQPNFSVQQQKVVISGGFNGD